MTGGGGYAQYDNVNTADVYPPFFEFKCNKYDYICESVAAFRWTEGKLYGLSVNGKIGNYWEYMYIHLQKRVMKFTPGLEAEDSFMIIPNEFVKDHELTQEEITALMTPDPEYERAMAFKYRKKSVTERIKRFMSKSRANKLFSLKIRINRILNRILNRRLSSIWKERGVGDTYGK